MGKFDNFLSPLSMIPGIGPDWKSSIAEDVGGGAAKYTIFKFFQAADFSRRKRFLMNDLSLSY